MAECLSSPNLPQSEISKGEEEGSCENFFPPSNPFGPGAAHSEFHNGVKEPNTNELFDAQNEELNMEEFHQSGRLDQTKTEKMVKFDSPNHQNTHDDDSGVPKENGCTDIVEGASTFDTNDDNYNFYGYDDDYDSPSAYMERLAQMEEEQEQLNSSLLALTSHFARVQLRLKQIVDASPEEKEVLLKELEEFAFRGIPDLREPKIDPQILPRKDADETESPEDQSQDGKHDGEENNQLQLHAVSSSKMEIAKMDPFFAEQKLEQQRQKQQDLMKKLKQQLEELESYAYETGDLDAIPSSMLLQRQAVIIEQLKGKLPLNLEDLDKLSAEELRSKVDKALKDLINPIIMKEQLVCQLKTQITDLERFIQFLQKRPDLSHGAKSHECTCACPMHGNSQTGLQSYNAQFAKEQILKNKGGHFDHEDEASAAIRMIQRALTLLQVFSWIHFGCANHPASKGKGKPFERNLLKRTTKGNHWGDLRARLEIAIDKIIELQSEKTKGNDSDYNTSDSEDGPTSCYLLNERMTSVVRKEFAVALRDLLQHGLIGSDQRDYDDMGPGSMMTAGEAASSWLLFGCFSTRSANTPSNRPLTIWDVILKYYYLKDGDEYNQSTARKLSQTFNLQMVGSHAITAKQSLLSTIYDIIQSHTRLKRSPDSHFKAFVCSALNQGKLVPWLKLIVKTQPLIESCYESWSYVASTNCEDALRSLDRLTHIKFNLAIDVAIRQLNNINDAF